ncbi:alkaline-phosphatase-like protein [Xylariaceae sp. FL1272]|nr:alkaline-phosphatase-like protein [Xylariaceae sp. FL1272]
MARWGWIAATMSCLASMRTSANTQTPILETSKQPNIVFILTDDQDTHMGSLDYMPLLKRHITDQGTSFERHFCTVSLCCPSRASMWSGKAAHNTNVTSLSPPYGGYPKFVENGFNENYLPIWLQGAGYNTYYVGKFLNSQSVNNYNKPHAAGWTGSDFQLDPFTYEYYNATFQRNYDPPVNHEGEYSVDLVKNKSLAFLDEAVEAGKPFFLTAAPIAPHSHVIVGGYWVNSTYYNQTSSTQAPPLPAQRHVDLFHDEVVPRTPSFNPPEPNGVAWISTLPRQNQTVVDDNDSWYRNRLRALQSVDEMIDELVVRLDEHGVLDNTYIFFSTDNGYHIGQHRLQPGKQCAYREDVNIPLMVRGPNIPQGVRSQQVTSHTDLVPTFLELAGARGPEDYFDGRVIDLTAPDVEDHRGDEHVNIEMWGIIVPEGKYGQILYPNHTYKALRLVGDGYDFLYTVWCTGEHELYDLVHDPYETRNLFPNNPWFPTPYNTTGPWISSMYSSSAQQSYSSTAHKSIFSHPSLQRKSNVLETASLKQLVSRLDSLVLVLKTCVARTCTHPWEVLHPAGNVQSLVEALDPVYDHFYEKRQDRVKFDSCLSGYLVSNELPVTVVPYEGDDGA